jgi:phosphoglycerate dehydrogenase-like enzyme
MIDHPDKMPALIGDTDVLITFGPMMAKDGLRGADKLQWIQALGTGVDGLIDQPALADHVVITNIKGIHGATCSEMAVLLMIALARDFPRTLRNQDKANWQRWPAGILDGRKAGILGVGLIAESLAPILKAFNMEVVAYSQTARGVPGIDAFFSRDQLLATVGDLDYLVVLVPYSPETKGLVSAQVLAAMKPSAYLVNLARGGVLDEDALIDAVETGSIAGAALDVFLTEPLPEDHKLWKMDKVIVTPHQAGFYDRYVDEALKVIEANMHHFLAGETDKMINLIERN